jgi:hypothetical protein
MRQLIAFSLLLVFLACLRAQAGERESSVGTAARSRQAGAAQSTPSLARQTVEHSLRSVRAQTELPEPKRRRVIELSEPAPAIPLEMAQVLLWSAVAVFAGIVVYTLIENLRLPIKSAAKSGKAVQEELQAVHRRMGVAQDAADMFAANGNFAEAMHTLLLQSLDEMRRRLGVPIAISLTSREILSRVALHSDAKDAFSDIVTRVEISYFGDHAPGAEEYRQCRQSYSTLSGFLKGGSGGG